VLQPQLIIERGASVSPRRFRVLDASKPSSNDKTVPVLDKVCSLRAAARLSYGTGDLSVIRITNLGI
jgi:hypothetical protein